MNNFSCLLEIIAPAFAIGFSVAFRFCICIVYISILVLSSGAPIVLDNPSDVPYKIIYPKTFFSLGLIGPRPLRFLLSKILDCAIDDMLKNPEVM